MFLVVNEVVAEEAVATGLASAAALLQATAPPLLHPLQVVPEHHHDAEQEDRLHQTDPDRRLFAVHDAPPPIQDLQSLEGEETSLGLPAMTAEGYPEIPRDLLPPKLKASRAHHRPGCQDRDHARLRAVVGDPQAVHEALFESDDAGTLRLKPTHMVRVPTSRSVSAR
jgi:hypothetical protein